MNEYSSNQPIRKEWTEKERRVPTRPRTSIEACCPALGPNAKAKATAENAPDVAPPYAPGKISRADMQGSERTVTVDSIADLIPGVRGAHGPDGMEGCAQPPALPSSLSSPSPTSTYTFGAIGVRAAASTAAAEDAAAAEMAGAAAHACDADAAMQPSGAAKEALQSATGAAELAVPAAAMSAEIRSTAAAAAATQEAFTAAIARVPARLLSPHAPCHLVFLISRYLAPSSCSCCTGSTLGSPPAPLESSRSSCTDPDDTSSQPRQPPPLPSQPPPSQPSPRSHVRHIVWPRLNRPQAQRSAHRLVDLPISLLACLCVVSTDPFTQVKSSHGKKTAVGTVPCVSIQLTLSQTRRCVSPSSGATRGSVSCGSGWSVPRVSIQLTLSQTKQP